MAQGGVSPKKCVGPSSFSKVDQRKFYALNRLRCGEVHRAYVQLFGEKKAEAIQDKLFYLDRFVKAYTPETHERFVDAMARLSIDLEVAGL